MERRVAAGRGCASSPRSAHAWLATAIAAYAIAACACGDKQGRAQHPRGEQNNPATASTIDAGVDSAGDRTAGGDSALTETECAGLVAHVLEIAERRFRAQAAKRGDPIPTEAQLQKIRESLQSELGAACLRMQRKDYECAMSAEDAAALAACQAAEAPVEN